MRLKPAWPLAGWCVPAALLALGAWGRAPQESPSAETIVQRALQRARQDRANHAGARYTYRQHSVNDELDSTGAVTKHEDLEYEVVPIGNALYPRLVRKDGKPLSEKRAREERERERKFREKQAKPSSEKKDEDDISFNEDLVNRFRFTLAGEEAVNGRPAYVLSFAPKSQNMPVRKRIDRFLNEVAGRLWVDQQDYEIARGEAHLVGDVTMWGGLLVSIKDFQVRFEQFRMNDGVWLLGSARGWITGRILIRSFRQRFLLESSGFQKLPNNGLGAATR